LAAPLDLAGAGSIAPAHAQSAICAEVKIETKQKLSFEGQAFDAPMRVNNGFQTDDPEGLQLSHISSQKPATPSSRPSTRATHARFLLASGRSEMRGLACSSFCLMAPG